MSDALDDLRNGLTTWYMGLDQRTQGFFETLYAEDAALVAGALGGSQIAADEIGEHATLASMLGADSGGDVTSVVPCIGAAAPPVIAPAAPVPGADFTVQWTDMNFGSASFGHVDQVALIDASNALVVDASVDVAALERSAQSPLLDVTFEGPAPGTYTLRILHNKDGVEMGYAQYASRKEGILSYTDTALTVREPAPTAEIAEFELGPLAMATGQLHWVMAETRPGHHLALADAIEMYVDAFPPGRVDPSGGMDNMTQWIESIRRHPVVDDDMVAATIDSECELAVVEASTRLEQGETSWDELQRALLSLAIDVEGRAGDAVANRRAASPPPAAANPFVSEPYREGQTEVADQLSEDESSEDEGEDFPVLQPSASDLTPDEGGEGERDPYITSLNLGGTG